MPFRVGSPSAIDYAILSMSYLQLGQNKDAQEAKSEFDKLMAQNKYAEMATSKSFAMEVEEAFSVFASENP